MPNWCSNYLTITGNPKELNKLMKQVEITKSESTESHYQSVFSLQKIVPRPASADPDWYEWNTRNWGTKWDTSEPFRSENTWEQGELLYSFETAWSPVTIVIDKLAKKYKKLSFKYSYVESGCDFWGEEEWEKGELVSQEGGELSEAGCERLNDLLGEHHWCNECGGEIPCIGKELTKEVCEECFTDMDNLDEPLWGEEKNAGVLQSQ